MKILVCDVCGEKCEDASDYIIPQYNDVYAYGKDNVPLIKLSNYKLEPCTYNLCEKCKMTITSTIKERQNKLESEDK